MYVVLVYVCVKMA